MKLWQSRRSRSEDGGGERAAARSTGGVGTKGVSDQGHRWNAHVGRLGAGRGQGAPGGSTHRGERLP